MRDPVLPEMQIVKLAPEEWQLYKQLRLEALLMEPQAFTSQYADALQKPDAYWQGHLTEAQAGEKCWLLFAKDKERVIGMVGAYCGERSDVVEIISVYVTREARGQGVATALMTAILAKVSQRGTMRKAVLAVNAGQVAAVALYRHFGYQTVGEEQRVTDDGHAYLTYIMEKELR